nr:hypothetical protein HK105_000001 [Polyrhizophydium stewartii]
MSTSNASRSGVKRPAESLDEAGVSSQQSQLLAPSRPIPSRIRDKLLMQQLSRRKFVRERPKNFVFLLSDHSDSDVGLDSDTETSDKHISIPTQPAAPPPPKSSKQAPTPPAADALFSKKYRGIYAAITSAATAARDNATPPVGLAAIDVNSIQDQSCAATSADPSPKPPLVSGEAVQDEKRLNIALESTRKAHKMLQAYIEQSSSVSKSIAMNERKEAEARETLARLRNELTSIDDQIAALQKRKAAIASQAADCETELAKVAAIVSARQTSLQRLKTQEAATIQDMIGTTKRIDELSARLHRPVPADIAAAAQLAQPLAKIPIKSPLRPARGAAAIKPAHLPISSQRPGAEQGSTSQPTSTASAKPAEAAATLESAAAMSLSKPSGSSSSNSDFIALEADSDDDNVDNAANFTLDLDGDPLATRRTLSTNDPMHLDNEQGAVAVPAFKPYESALGHFRTFHLVDREANFSQFTSLTWSAKLNPAAVMCPFETSGGKCADSTCKNQHFRDLSMTDGELFEDLMETSARLLSTADVHALRDELHAKKRSGASLSELNQAVLAAIRRPDAAAIDKNLFLSTRIDGSRAAPAGEADARNKPAVRKGIARAVLDASAAIAPALPVMCRGLAALVSSESAGESRYYQISIAAADFEKLLAKDPHDVGSWISYAASQIKAPVSVDSLEKHSPNFNQALEILSRALVSNRSSEHVWLMYLELYQRRGKASDVRELFEQAIGFLPDCPVLWWMWASFERAEPAGSVCRVLCKMLVHFSNPALCIGDPRRRSLSLLSCVVQLAKQHVDALEPHKAAATLSRFLARDAEQLAEWAREVGVDAPPEHPLGLLNPVQRAVMLLLAVHVHAFGFLPENGFCEYPNHQLVKQQLFTVNWLHPLCAPSDEAIADIDALFAMWHASLCELRGDAMIDDAIADLDGKLDGTAAAFALANQACRTAFKDSQPDRIVQILSNCATLSLYRHALDLDITTLPDGRLLELRPHVSRAALHSSVFLWLNYMLLVAACSAGQTPVSSTMFDKALERIKGHEGRAVLWLEWEAQDLVALVFAEQIDVFPSASAMQLESPPKTDSDHQRAEWIASQAAQHAPSSSALVKAASRQGSLAALGPAANELSRSLQAVMDSQTNATESAHARRRSLTADPNGPRDPARRGFVGALGAADRDGPESVAQLRVGGRVGVERLGKRSVTHISDRVARLETEFGSWRQKIDAQMLEHEHFMGMLPILMQQPGVIERFDALERSVRAMLRRIDGVESDTNDDDDDLGSPTRDSVDTDLSKTSRVTRQPRISVSAAQGDVISDEMSEQDFCRRMEMLEKLVSDINRRAKNILEAHNRGLADHATPAGVKHSSSFGQTPQAMAHNAKALDELIEDIRERSQTLASRSDKSCATAQHSGGLEKQLSAIQAQMAALSRRLDSLDDGRSHLRAPSALSASAAFGSSFGLQASGTSTPATQKKGSPAPDIGAAAAQSLANHRRRSTIASSEFQPTSDSKHGEPSQFETQWPVPTAHPSAAAVATREDLRKLHKRLAEKVDTAVLEELVRHIATRDELKSAVDKRAHLAWVEKLIERRTKSMRKEISGLTAKQESRDSEPQHDFDQRARGVVDAEIQKHVEAVSHEMDLKLAALRREFHLEASLAQGREGAAKHARHRSEGGQDSVAALESRLKSEFKAWIRKHVASQMDESWLAADERHKALYEQIEQTVQERVSTLWREHTQMLDDHREEFETVQTVARRLTREFDEKLYLLCSDLSACKTLFAKQVSQPFYRCGQWLWRSGTLKMGSGVPWNMQSVNTDPDNFKWDQDHINLRVSEAGLYEITLAIFTKSKPSIQLVVNGESVLSAINSPSYIVHHSSGFVVDGDGRVEPGTVTGISLVDFLALPSKTTLSIHYHGVRKQASLGHGFVGLRRL